MLNKAIALLSISLSSILFYLPVLAQTTTTSGSQSTSPEAVRAQHSLRLGTVNGCGIWLNPRGRALGARGTYMGAQIESSVLIASDGDPGCQGVFQVRQLSVFCRNSSVGIENGTFEGLVNYEPLANNSETTRIADIFCSASSQTVYPETYQVPYSRAIDEEHSVQVGADRSGCGIWLNPQGEATGETVRSTVLLHRKGAGTGSMCNGVFEVRPVTVSCRDRSGQIEGYTTWTRNQSNSLSARTLEVLCSRARL